MSEHKTYFRNNCAPREHQESPRELQESPRCLYHPTLWSGKDVLGSLGALLGSLGALLEHNCSGNKFCVRSCEPMLAHVNSYSSILKHLTLKSDGFSSKTHHFLMILGRRRLRSACRRAGRAATGTPPIEYINHTQ